MIEVIIPLWTLVQLMFAIVFGIVIGGGVIGSVLWILTRGGDAHGVGREPADRNVTRPRSRW